MADNNESCNQLAMSLASGANQLSGDIFELILADEENLNISDAEIYKLRNSINFHCAKLHKAIDVYLLERIKK